MSLSINKALSMINPAESRAQRMEREDRRLQTIEQNIARDRQMDRLDEQQFSQEMAKIAEASNKLLPEDQKRVQKYMSEVRKNLYDNFKKAGSATRFMRQGGMAMVQEYQDKFMNSDVMAIARNNAVEFARMQKFDEKDIPISEKSRLQYELWKEGKRKSFTIQPLMKIDLSQIQKTRYNTENITPQEIMQQYRTELTANWMAENGATAYPDDKTLLKYTKRHYGNIKGVQIDPYQVSTRNGSGQSSSGGTNGTSKTTKSSIKRRQATIVQSALSDMNAATDPSYLIKWGDDPTLHQALKTNGLTAAGIVSEQKFTAGNSSDMRFQEAYEIKGMNAEEIPSALGYQMNNGFFNIQTGSSNVYNAQGLNRANNESDFDDMREDISVAVRPKRILMTKEFATALRPDANSQELGATSQLLMWSMDGKARAEQEARFQKDMAAASFDGRAQAAQVLEVEDADGNSYYIKFGEGADASRLNQYYESKLNFADEIVEAADMNASSQIADQARAITNAVNKQEYDASIKPITAYLDESMYDVDEFIVAPMINSLADHFMSAAGNNETRNRSQIIQEEVLPLIDKYLDQSKDLRNVFHGNADNPLPILQNYISQEMAPLLKSYEYYAKLS